MIRILVAEDYPIIREGICRLLEGCEGFQVIGQAKNGLEALNLTRELHPDVLVLDISMPEMDGIDALKQMMGFTPQPRVVILSIYADPALVQMTLGLGVLGYVLKQSISDELIDAIRAANRGSGYLSVGVSHLLTNHPINRQPPNLLERLSPRESEVVKKIVAGKSTKEIAEDLQTSVKTVEKQRRDAMRKLEVENVASLVRVSLELGLATGNEGLSVLTGTERMS
jgi:DNA-binding NarL/FixJ family response regulator